MILRMKIGGRMSLVRFRAVMRPRLINQERFGHGNCGGEGRGHLTLQGMRGRWGLYLLAQNIILISSQLMSRKEIDNTVCRVIK